MVVAGQPLPKETLCSFQLADGRALSYYKFSTIPLPADENNNTMLNKKKHPVLHLHGFPGCGLEGITCAQEVADANGELFAIDRPGFGYSDPLPTTMDEQDPEDAETQVVVQDLWEFVKYMKWETFSVIGVSGGGPFALALLSNYMDAQKSGTALAKLDSVAVVAGCCCSAGIDDMIPDTQEIYKTVSAANTSRLSRAKLSLMFTIPSFLSRILPTSLLLGTLPKDLPQVDRDVFEAKGTSDMMGRIVVGALRQGGTPSKREACVLFRSKQKFESNLKASFQSDSVHVPRTALFHGMVDRNVPFAHSKYVQDELLNGKAKFVTYEDMGHISLVVTEANDYAHFAVPEVN